MRTVKDVCEEHYEKWKFDCSGFLKAVAADLGISLHGQADDIIDRMGLSPWLQLNHDPTKAVQLAGRRYLVVAGLKEKPNGHVAIIMPGTAVPYPTAYWGSMSKHPGRNKTLNWSWTHADLPKVSYFANLIPTPIAIV